ncbi:unnamed protein product [Ceratitis capitata]|uniref:(Mediterranean fruit fly) hypothetical protein n=2 Tax=Ceratitis capitata TaxID=7213 RepID=A0A811V4R3_CERCA|nr:unnamed protein product [Ceratitis capitata]
MFKEFAILIGVLCVNAEIEKNTINEDGSFSFRHSNNDIGGYYHSASASPDNTVSGRYGSRNPLTGQVEEVVYTAGPRGFRVNGPKIHREMDLSQYSVRQRGNADDPLADPFDDPSYSFSFRSEDQSRTENSDYTGHVRGLYSYLDDVGESHSVRYAAGAGTGFTVLNSVPDSPVNVAYVAPLYKAHPKTRGKMTTQRGPNGTYKLIAAGPDHRRAESRSRDGFVRGTYSYLDDAGVQRTVEYIAGPGIGYRIVKNRMGPGSHINPSLNEFRLSDTDFKLANDFEIGNIGGTRDVPVAENESRKEENYLKNANSSSKNLQSVESNKLDKKKSITGESVRDDELLKKTKSDRMGAASTNRGATRYGGTLGDNYDGGYNFSLIRNRQKQNDDSHKNRKAMSSVSHINNRNRTPNSSASHNSVGNSRNRDSATDSYNYDSPSSSTDSLGFSDDDLSSLPPLITSSQKFYKWNEIVTGCNGIETPQ